MNLSKAMEYYSRDDVKGFLAEFSRDREVSGMFRSGGFSQRPNVILYPNDVTAMVKSGMVEFHGSVERWSQPMSLGKGEYSSLRKGWDLILDLDCSLFEHGRIAAEAFLWALRKHDIRGASVKFTGGTGFHIGVPWESMPRRIDYKPSESLYPELPRNVISYLKDFTAERFERMLYKKYSEEDLAKQVNKPLGRIVNEEGLNVYEIVEVDPVLISPRHLFRLPYSINKKTGLVSLPMEPKKVVDFECGGARPHKVKVEEGFLDKGKEDEAELLIAETKDWYIRSVQKEERKKERERVLSSKAGEDTFPPCINNISGGLSDGRKRSVFILINFLRSANWSWDEIEGYMLKWNERNSPAIRENYIRSQVRWHRNRNKKLPPPNCDKEGWYADFGVCEPDETCGGESKNVKNPVNYVLRSLKKGRGRKPAKRRKAGSKRKAGPKKKG